MSWAGFFFADIFELPQFGMGALAVWLRNFLYFRYTFVLTMFWILLEPLLYLGAMGFGLGSFVTEIDGISYAQFFFTGLMAANGGMVAFFEGSYASYTKLSRQKTFDTILLAPIGVDDISMGEIAWATSKGFLSSLGVLVVGMVLGLTHSPMILLGLIPVAMTCWLFAAFGFLMAAKARNYDWFTYSQSGIIIPMSLFCGTYFPTDRLPWGLKAFAYVLPLTHGVEAVRTLAKGIFDSSVLLNIVILFVYIFLLTNLATSVMRRRILV